MREKDFCLSREELRLVQAKLKAAVNFGFISEAGLDAIEFRCQEHNRRIANRLVAGEVVYGLTHFSLPAYLQYELTRFRLDFVEGKAGNYDYMVITEAHRRRFYQDNPEMFKRCIGDYFAFEDVEAVIEKRIREEEYYRYVQNLLCQCQ